MLVSTLKHTTLAFPCDAEEGRRVMVALLAARFDLSSGKPEPKPAEIDLVDTFHGEDAASASIRRPSQLFHDKPGTDVVLLGRAHAGAGKPTHVDVRLRFGGVDKTIRAHGMRVWQAGTFGGLAPGPALPIVEPVPLIYELAWGGQDLSDPEAPIGEPRNYVGRGVARNAKALVGKPAAQLEYPDRPIGRGAGVPAAFNPIHRHWRPRADFAGTYDAAWMENRMPVLPRDFDCRFHRCVAEDQWSAIPLRGDEPVEILGARPEGRWSFRLPRIAPGFSSVVLGRRKEHATHLDTVVIDADARTVDLYWRAAIPVPRKWEMIERILVFGKAVVSASNHADG